MEKFNGTLKSYTGKEWVDAKGEKREAETTLTLGIYNEITETGMRKKDEILIRVKFSFQRRTVKAAKPFTKLEGICEWLNAPEHHEKHKTKYGNYKFEMSATTNNEKCFLDLEEGATYVVYLEPYDAFENAKGEKIKAGLKLATRPYLPNDLDSSKEEPKEEPKETEKPKPTPKTEPNISDDDLPF